MDNLQTGLMVSLVGITITFFALFVFIGVILVLKKLFPPKMKSEVTTSGSSINPAIPVGSDEDDPSEAIVAAIAASVYLRSRRSDQLGAALLAGPGPYKTMRQIPKPLEQRK